LYIKENQVRVMFLDQIDSFHTVLALSHHIDLARIFQEVGKFVTGKLFVINDDCG
jgi:hypothetical protein